MGVCHLTIPYYIKYWVANLSFIKIQWPVHPMLHYPTRLKDNPMSQVPWNLSNISTKLASLCSTYKTVWKEPIITVSSCINVQFWTARIPLFGPEAIFKFVVTQCEWCFPHFYPDLTGDALSIYAWRYSIYQYDFLNVSLSVHITCIYSSADHSHFSPNHMMWISSEPICERMQ